ncbi:helix-turn-helix domain-containing protein [Streptomyces nodosus]|uniref:DNA-binding protein n=1 Tax=Streptomyces nodosus TaxID=40318 RepID=A0A0B5DKU4_9ACTN|nr:helix-turn-helix transcriptional regulator [Streptomyces nodosus]AJE41066.1 DNA-binding protein [Streptomyces nodosus]MBB4792184.1 transcriptional regulator with XRE-family HTH domain [Streptomyces nodosus]QEV39607.1 XRE family transcriptional regulator [Streptomyces nodosus]
MALRHEPTARQLRLAAELRRLRDEAGLTARDAAALLGVSPPQISQIEAGLTGVSEKRLRRLAANYACSDGDLVDALVDMATDRTQGWWEEYRGVLPAAYCDLAELDHHATFRHDVAVLHVPGLFQTEEYARALFAYMNPEFPETEVQLRVDHRMKRKVVVEGPTPMSYETVIHEAALRISVAGRAATRAQLARILDMSEAGHVTVRVIPFALDDFAGAGSTMVYLGGAVPRLDTVVRDAPHGTAFVDSAAQLEHFRMLFRRVKAASLPPEQSRDLIHELAKEL